jgi:hypothetical protein
MCWIFWAGGIGGWSLAEGCVFCMHPTLNYLTGCFNIRKK